MIAYKAILVIRDIQLTKAEEARKEKLKKERLGITAEEENKDEEEAEQEQDQDRFIQHRGQIPN